MSIIGNHPKDFYGIYWTINKWMLVILFFLGFQLDLNNNTFYPLTEFLSLRMILFILFLFSITLFFIAQSYWFIKKDEELISNKYEPIEDEDFKNVFDNYKHADDLYHQRFNFFLVAESMLIMSFSTTLSVNLHKIILLGICILAFIYTVSWFYVNKRIHWRLTYLNFEYLTRNENYRNYIKSVFTFTFFRTGAFLTFILPLATFLFWYFAFLYAYWII